MKFDFYNNCKVLQKELVTDVLTTRADAISRVRVLTLTMTSAQNFTYLNGQTPVISDYFICF